MEFVIKALRHRKPSSIINGFQGRIIDLVKIEATNFTRITFLVFDEADRMFDMGFGRLFMLLFESWIDVRWFTQIFCSSIFESEITRIKIIQDKGFHINS